MQILLAAVIAAVISWTGNKLLTRAWKAEGIVFITPLLEETAKTIAALSFGQHLVLVHGAFGIIEGIYDYGFGRKNGPTAAFASIVGHLFYGVITFVVYKSWSILAGIIAAYAAHSLWNAFVLKALVRRVEE